MLKNKKHPEAEALFKSADVPNLVDQARSDREADSRATQNKTANLKLLRLAKEAVDRAAASAKSMLTGRNQKD